jgi:hypothetical protein
VLDNFENGHRQAVHPEAIIEECDIRNKASVDAVFFAAPYRLCFTFWCVCVCRGIHDPSGRILCEQCHWRSSFTQCDAKPNKWLP